MSLGAAGIDRAHLRFFELEGGEGGHVDAAGATVLLGQLLQLLLQFAFDLGRGVDQLAAAGMEEREEKGKSGD